MKFGGILNWCNLNLRPLCQTLSNALDTSLSTRQHWFLFASASAIISVVTARAVSVDLFFLKPCWLAGSILLCSRCVSSLLFNIFSYILPGNSRSEMGL